MYNQDQQVAFLVRDGFTVAKSKKVDFKLAYKEDDRGVVFQYYFGKAKAKKRYRVSSMKELQRQFTILEANRITRVGEIAERRKSVKASDFWAVGDVGSYSWGYEQTNVDWFEVVAVGKATIKIRKIASLSSDNGGGSGKCQPVRGQFLNDEIKTKRVQRDGYINMEHGCLSKWDGTAKFTSSWH